MAQTWSILHCRDTSNRTHGPSCMNRKRCDLSGRSAISSRAHWRVCIGPLLLVCAVTPLLLQTGTGWFAALKVDAIPSGSALYRLRSHHQLPFQNPIPCWRGVTGEQKAQYCCTGLFACGDPSGRMIPCGQVNDDYCDCLSGRDEPGTAACSAQGAMFACASDSRLIPGAFVDDGVLDCLDASDELGLSHTRNQ